MCSVISAQIDINVGQCNKFVYRGSSRYVRYNKINMKSYISCDFIKLLSNTCKKMLIYNTVYIVIIRR